MKLQILEEKLTVCKLTNTDSISLNGGIVFIGVTDEEISLVCETEKTPSNTTEREDGWRGFRITGVLDFSLIGILSKISAVLAENKIGIFVVSTFNTDYILVKAEKLEDAKTALSQRGYEFS